MVDEFIYQFQSFSQYRGKLAQKSPHELELLKKCDGVWDLQGVLHYLQGLIDKSGVVRELATDGEVLKLFSCTFIAVFALLQPHHRCKTPMTNQASPWILLLTVTLPFPSSLIFRPQCCICSHSLCLSRSAYLFTNHLLP